MGQLVVFIGSSAEARNRAEDLQALLQDAGAQTIPWWRADVFPAGVSFLQSLQNAVSKTNAALLVISEDDKVESRDMAGWAPRDNVLFEYGLFTGSHKPTRTAMAVLGNPKLPTDL